MMLDDADDTNVLMMPITILIRLPFADNDDGNAAANNDVANEDDPNSTNKSKLKQNPRRGGKNSTKLS